MAFDSFLKLEGITGESMDSGHKGEIDILSVQWGIIQPATGHGGGGSTAGKAEFNDVVITKKVDSSSPLLYKHCADGTHIPSGKLVCRKAGGAKPLEYILINMDKVIVSSIQMSGSRGDEMMETVALNFSKVALDYVPQKEDGSGAAKIPFTWDIKQNKA